MLKSLWRFLYPIMFFALVGGAIYGLYWLHPFIVYFYLACLLLMIARYNLNLKGRTTRWAVRVLTSIDQHWQVLLSPILNLAPDLYFRFGNEDETASSVVGKNLKFTNARHWIVIEWVLSHTLEGGRPHSIPSIEDDE